MFAAQETLAFFPTYVWVFDLPADEARHLNETIRGRLAAGGSAVPGQDEHFQQTQTDLQNREEFQKLSKFALSAANEILDFLKIECDAFEVTGCWVNIGPVGAAHRQHSHPNNFLSGVYYARVSPGGDTITFSDPRLQAHVIAPRIREPSTRTASSVNVGVRAGRLVLFPAWLRHSVSSNRSDHQRISVAINVMFTDYVARMSRPRWSGAVRI